MFEIRNDIVYHFGQAAVLERNTSRRRQTGGTDPKASCTLRCFLHRKKAKRPSNKRWPLRHLPGNDLLSQDPAVQVSSALEVLTSVFEMGTGGTPPE